MAIPHPIINPLHQLYDQMVQQFGQDDVNKYKKFKKVDGASYEKVNQFLRKHTYITAREWAIARRLLDWGQISKVKYDKLAQGYEQEWQEARQQQKESQAEGGPSHYLLKLINNGYAFSRVVLSAYQNGDVSGRDTSSLLGVKLDKIGNLVELIGIPGTWKRVLFV